VGLAVLTAACTGTPPTPPPTPKPNPSGAGVGPVFAYSDQGALRVMRGRDEVKRIGLDGEDAVADADWAPDGSRFVATTGKKLISLDVRTGASASIDCNCGSVALAGGRVYTGTRDAKELTVRNAVNLNAEGALPVKAGAALGLENLDGAGNRLVAYEIIATGARDESNVVVLDPATGASTTVGTAITGGGGVYTPRGWRGGPMYAYLVTGSTGAQSGVAEARWFDPLHPTKQVVTDDGALRAETPDVPDSEFNSGMDQLWWAADGTLRSTAWTWSCRPTEPLNPPECRNKVPHTQWRYDGTEWSQVDKRELATTQAIGDGWSLEVSQPPDDKPLERRLTVISRGERTDISPAAGRVWTPPQLATPPTKKKGDQKLATRLAPQVWLYKDEPAFPSDTEFVVRSSTLRFDHGDLCVNAPDPITAQVDEAKLADDTAYQVKAGICGQEQNWPTFQTTKSSNLGKGNGKGFYLDFSDDKKVRAGYVPDDRKQVHAPVYWDYYDPDDSDRDAYLFWFFYPYDDYTGDHESDWEHVAVQVEGDKPVGMTFFRHELPPCFVSWDYLEMTNGQPVVYSAQGAHGSYPRAGDYPRHNFKDQWGTDHTGKGFQWNTAADARSVVEQPWYGYRGLWGEIGLIDATTGKLGPYPGRDMSRAMTADPCPREPAQLPAEFTGKWKTTQPVTDPTTQASYQAELTINLATAGQRAGTSNYPGLGCTGTLSMLSAYPDRIVLAELRSPAPQLICANTGTIVLTRSGDGLLFSYTGDNRPGTATAQLVRE
jgi:hypothetical protein